MRLLILLVASRFLSVALDRRDQVRRRGLWVRGGTSVEAVDPVEKVAVHLLR